MGLFKFRNIGQFLRLRFHFAEPGQPIGGFNFFIPGLGYKRLWLFAKTGKPVRGLLAWLHLLQWRCQRPVGDILKPVWGVASWRLGFALERLGEAFWLCGKLKFADFLWLGLFIDLGFGQLTDPAEIFLGCLADVHGFVFKFGRPLQPVRKLGLHRRLSFEFLVLARTVPQPGGNRLCGARLAFLKPGR